MPDMLDGDKLLSRNADVESVDAVAAHDTRGGDGVHGDGVCAEGIHGGRFITAVVCMTVVHVVSLGMAAFLRAMVAFWTVMVAFCDGLVQGGGRGRGGSGIYNP